MAFPTGYVYHNGKWYNQLTGVEYDPYEQVQDITEAALALLTPSADFIGVEYDVTDRAGGTRVKNTGTTFREVSPGASEFVTTSTWALRGTGAVRGQIKAFTDIMGGLTNPEGWWDGTYWRPRGGLQLLYDLPGTLLGTSANPSVITFPTLTVPAGLMNIKGGFIFEFHSSVTDGTNATANTVALSFGGFELFGTDQGAAGRLWESRRVRNENATNAQTVMANASATGAYIAANNSPKTTNRNTATDLTLSGTITTTTGGARTAQLDELKVWWIG